LAFGQVGEQILRQRLHVNYNVIEKKIVLTLDPIGKWEKKKSSEIRNLIDSKLYMNNRAQFYK
jgi:hypothetical protein